MLADISKSADPISESWTRTLWFPSSITVVASASDIITSGEREREEEEEDGNNYIFVCNIKGSIHPHLSLVPRCSNHKEGEICDPISYHEERYTQLLHPQEEGQNCLEDQRQHSQTSLLFMGVASRYDTN